MSDDDENNGKQYRMHGSLGDLELTVKGPDPEWVEKRFEEAWADRLAEAAEMKEAIRQADMSAQ